MMRPLPILLPILLLCGCAATCPAIVPAERVVLQDHDVIVEVARKPPPEVRDCWAHLPAPPTLQDAQGGWLISGAQIENFKLVLHAYRACDDGWRAWAMTP